MKTKNVVRPVETSSGSVVDDLKGYILNILPMIYRRLIIDGNRHIAEPNLLLQIIMGRRNQGDPYEVFISDLCLKAGGNFSYVYGVGGHLTNEAVPKRSRMRSEDRADSEGNQSGQCKS